MTNCVEEMNIRDLEEKVDKKFESVDKKIAKLEYEEIRKVRDDVQEIKIDLTKNNTLTEQLKEIIKDGQRTMESVRETMIALSKSNEELAINLRQQNEKIDKIQEKQNKNDEEFEVIRTRMNENEQKSSFDIILFIKNNFINIIVGAGILSYIFFTK